MGVLLCMNKVNLVPFVYTKVGLFYSLIRDNQRRPNLCSSTVLCDVYYRLRETDTEINF
jgi:hypothetical protein